MTCNRPFYVRNPAWLKAVDRTNIPSWIPVPCGKCYGCRQAKINRWIRQLEAESYKHASAIFLSLTFDNEHLGINPDATPEVNKAVSEHFFASQGKSILQKFFKRLRKDGLKFRYFAVSEHGTLKGRPHYHAILFGLDSGADKLIRENWPYGKIVDVRPLDFHHFRYVVNYCTKAGEFYLFSKGLGYSTFEEDYHSGKLQGSLSGKQFNFPQWFARSRFSDADQKALHDLKVSHLEPYDQRAHDQKEIDLAAKFRLRDMA